MVAVNIAKTVSTAILHNDADRRLPNHRSNDDARAMMETALQYKGAKIHYTPASEANKYLGVQFRFDLSGDDNCEAMQAKLVKHIGMLEASALFKGDIWALVLSTLIPKARYGLAIGLYEDRHIKQIQKQLTDCLKRACGLHNSTQNAFLTLSTAAGGPGVPDLGDLYCQEAADAMQRALTNDGRLGRLFRQVYLAQLERADHDISKARTNTTHSPICRRIAYLAKHNVRPSDMRPTLSSLKCAPATAHSHAQPPATTPEPSPTPPALQQRVGTKRRLTLCRIPHLRNMTAAYYEWPQFERLRKITDTRMYHGKQGTQQQHLSEWEPTYFERTFYLAPLLSHPHQDDTRRFQPPYAPPLRSVQRQGANRHRRQVNQEQAPVVGTPSTHAR